MSEIQKKSYISKKYNLSFNSLKDEHIPYYYTKYPELCCNYILQPIYEDIKPFEFNKAISYLNEYYKNIKSDYYKNLLNELKKNKLSKDMDELPKYMDELPKYMDELPKDIIKLPEDIADRIIYEYIKFRKNIFCITLWPMVSDDISYLLKYLKKFGYVYYIKKINLDYNSALNLIYQLYSDTSRINTIEKIEKNKLKYLGWDINNKKKEKTIRIIYFDNTSNEVISGSRSVLKTKIRDLLLKQFNDHNLRGDDLCHINDHYYQTIEYSKIFLHKQSLYFLKKQDLKNHLSKKFDLGRLYVNTIKNWYIKNINFIDYERILFMDSVTLYSYGIRPCNYIHVNMSTVNLNETIINNIATFFLKEKTKFPFVDFNTTDKNLSDLLDITHIDDLIFNPDRKSVV